ncbi:ABC transporter ATP-binding protein [Fictibacillus sp. FJAT-27399]|uniref:ABC transporter ATP-binding protein n=1 Tax=Fictibacillus sp. FJAT-27399 TaxID=1729689 RepID=UPI000782910C|nr:ABC transporter ATP-binding protein [Fictibacillus sp. FJAT-27399]
MSTTKTYLQLKGIGKRFGGNWAIKDVDLDVKQGEMIGIIGPNGAGKTTLFNMITGFLNPTEGDVYFKDQQVTNHKPPAICQRGIARTFQIVKPFGHLSVLENVMVGLLTYENNVIKAREKAKYYVDLAGLSRFLDMPANSLSIGNRKRLELARALATKPELVLLDEVMGGLNDEETEEMIQIIKGLHKEGLTIVIIEHNMHALMSLSERVVVLCYGQKLAEGNPEEISTNKDVIDAYLGRE